MRREANLKVKEVLKEGKDLLSEISDAPMLEAEVLLSYLLNLDRAALVARSDEEVDNAVKEKFISLIAKRADGVPLYYILGKKEFMGIEFFINESVLIPRQETETLVEEALKLIGNKAVSVLDVGTGSGCILLSFLYYNKKSRGIGIDISSGAIEVARKNAELLGLSERAKFKEADFRAFRIDERFDIVLSNPPYVRTDEVKQLKGEPEVALSGGKDGLDVYPQLAQFIAEVLKENGTFIVEVDYRSARKVKGIFESAGFRFVKFLKDLSGRNRFIEGVKFEGTKFEGAK